MNFKLEAREMSEKAQYRTRQITELENYLCSMEGKHVTVTDRRHVCFVNKNSTCVLQKQENF